MQQQTEAGRSRGRLTEESGMWGNELSLQRFRGRGGYSGDPFHKS